MILTMILLAAAGVISEIIAHSMPPSNDIRIRLPRERLDEMDRKLDKAYEAAKEEIRRMR